MGVNQSTENGGGFFSMGDGDDEVPQMTEEEEEQQTTQSREVHLIVKNLQPLGDGCFQATNDDGYIFLLAERKSSLFAFVAFLASQHARKGYVCLIMESRRLSSLTVLEPLDTLPPEQQQQQGNGAGEDSPGGGGDDDDVEARKGKAKITAPQGDDDAAGVGAADVDLEGQEMHRRPPQQPLIPILPSPFIAGTPGLEGYDHLMGYRRIPVLGDFFVVQKAELDLYRMLAASRIAETFFLRTCKEYLKKCNTIPQIRKLPLEEYIRNNELCPYASSILGKEGNDGDEEGHRRRHQLSNGVPAEGSALSERYTTDRRGTAGRPEATHEDAVRQVLRAFEVFEGSIRASILTDEIIMLFNLVQQLLQATVEAQRVAQKPPDVFQVPYAVLAEIKLHMDEIKNKLTESQTHKSRPFSPEDVSHLYAIPPPQQQQQPPPPPPSNSVVVEVHDPPVVAQPPPPSSTSYPLDPHKVS